MITKNRLKFVVLGYYGFGNLGDELILRALVSQLSSIAQQLKQPIDLTVLSQQPEKTEASFSHFTSDLFQVDARPRMKPLAVWQTFQKADVFILGGGGLFQDETSVRSVVYYAGMVALACMSGVPVWMWGQGLTPFNTPIARWLTRWAFQQANCVVLRDEASVTLARRWCGQNVPVEQMVDAVWGLSLFQQPPSEVSSSVYYVGVSLRQWKTLTPQRLNVLACHLASALSSLVHSEAIEERGAIGMDAWVFQADEDRSVLAEFESCFQVAWEAVGSPRPVQWQWVEGESELLRSIEQCQAVVAMRFHACVLALKARKKLLALSYSAKVKRLLTQYHLPGYELADLDHLSDLTGEDKSCLGWLKTTPFVAMDEVEAFAQQDRQRLLGWVQAL